MLRSFLSLFTVVLVFIACTNLKVGQTQKRFEDNMSGTLRAFPNATVANSNDFYFSAFGDTHIGSDSGGNLLIMALQRSLALGDSFAVIAGDNSNSGLESEMRTFESQRLSVGLPSYPAIGNHDIFFDGWLRYRSIIGRSIYRFDAGIARFFVLDSANGTFGEDQLNWLRQELVSNTQPIKIIVTHFPIQAGEFSSLFKLSSDEEATVFKAMMHEFGVQLVISAHYHGYIEKNIGGTTYLVTGACNHILDIGNRPGLVRVHVTSAGVTTQPIFFD
jgi:hypothetical protein